MKTIEGGICAAKGFRANGIHCGIRKNKSKRDLSLIVSDVKATAAAVYTTNLVKGAPIAVTKKHIENGYAKAVICNILQTPAFLMPESLQSYVFLHC